MHATQRIKQYLITLQVWQLKRLAVSTGIATGSTKNATADSLINGLGTQSDEGGLTTTYKSVDMGVKNLALCVVKPTNQKQATPFKLLDWQRLDVLTADKALLDLQATPDESDEKVLTPTASLYSPSNLAPAAARLAQRLANDLKPTSILIERQRYRSAGGSAVQEWTLRVNSLEAMLWASLETMRNHKLRSTVDTFFPSTVEMNPARIAAFWNARGKLWGLDHESLECTDPVSGFKKKSDSEDDEVAKRGMEKSKKIALVRHWLEAGDVDVEKRLQPLANAFMQSGRARKADGDLVIPKKDDLADCVVQGVTFALWQQNRSLLRQHLESQAS